MQVDVIILSYCGNEDDFAVNNNCIQSLHASEQDIKFNVVLLESNSSWDSANLRYADPSVRVVVPNEPFNFNRFLNIGFSMTNNELIVFANNDVIFHKNWFTEILKVRNKNPAVRSWCPFDRTSTYLSWDKFNRKDYHLGYRVPVEFVGWCFVIERSVLNAIGKFDENFDLYFQDNDFALTLQKFSISHAMVPGSFVEHMGGYTTKQNDASNSPKYVEDRAKFILKWGEQSQSLLSGLVGKIKRLISGHLR